MHTMIGLHCSASSGRQWDAYSQLLPAGMRLIAPELMGYGPGERWPSGTPVDLEAEARRLAPLLFRQPAQCTWWVTPMAAQSPWRWRCAGPTASRR